MGETRGKDIFYLTYLHMYVKILAIIINLNKKRMQIPSINDSKNFSFLKG